MVTFCQLAHIVDATHLRFLCPWTHARCYANDGVGGVGWFCSLAHMVDATPMITVDATQLRFLCPWTHARCLDSPDPQRFLEELESCCDKKKMFHCTLTSSRYENMSDSSSFRFRENLKSSSFA